jgi:hypothetical protein
MRGSWRQLLVLLCACKAEIGGPPNNPDGAVSDEDGSVTPSDAPGTFGPWSAPVKIPGASSNVAEDDGSLSNSKLEIVFARADPAVDAGRKHLFYMSRPSVTSMQWSAPIELSFNLAGFAHETPRFSADDKKLFFASSRTGTTGGLDIWETTRPNVGSPLGWSTPTLVPNVNSAQTDKWCMPCSTGRYLMVSARTPTSTTDDIYEGQAGAAPTLVTQLTDADDGDTGPFITADCLTTYFASTRSGANKIYKATRTTANGTWSAPVPFDDFVASVGGAQSDPWISEDQRTMIFASDVSGSLDMYITTR